MELVFVTDWPKLDTNTWVKKLLGNGLSDWSCRNILAFTAVGNRKEPVEHREVTNTCIHILDPDRPWEIYSIDSGHEEMITSLKWNASGTQLLSTDSRGTCCCWEMNQYLLNSWIQSTKTNINKEPIVAADWLHGPIKLLYNVDKLDSINIHEKFSRVTCEPSVKNVGGKPVEGWVAVTATGLVSITVMEGGKLITENKCLGIHRSHVAVADIAFGGPMIIATSDGTCRPPIQAYSVNVTKTDDRLNIQTDSLPSFYPQCCTSSYTRDRYNTISHIQFMNREAGDKLLVTVTGSGGTYIECWSLSKEPVPLHNIFDNQKPVDQQPVTLKWVFMTSHSENATITALAVPKLPLNLSKTSMYNGPGMVIAAAFIDGNIKLLHRNSMKPLKALKYEGAKIISSPQAKRQRAMGGHYIVSLTMSSTCCSMVGVDKGGTLSLLKVAPTIGQIVDSGATRAHTIAQVVNLLEYCLVTGHDWWDLLLTITIGMVETVIDRLTEAYNRQNAARQALLFNRLLAMKATLHRLSSSGRGKAVDCHSKLLLNAIATEFKTLLISANNPENTPTDRIAAACASADADISSILQKIDSKDITVDKKLLKSTQQLTQWVAEYALYVLATVPVQGQMTTKPGVSILYDASTLSMLRQLLVIIKVFGEKEPLSLPVFTVTSAGLDGLSLLYKLLTSIWVSSNDDNVHVKLEDSIVDECILLPSQILIRSMEYQPVTEGIIGKLHIHSRQAMTFQFDNPPGHMITVATFSPGHPAEVNTRSLTDKTHQKHDVVRRLHLGVSPPEELKRCTRCSCISLLKSPTKLSTMIAWEQRWSRSCLCGGLWRKVIVP
ncbi:mediator of RNA polymerase II transcription subunit 16-like [Anneissia japonica]|uniref:mediator of RNA polymerase II transcription subunit 16-like n=1 Tax=Anneissia japonica TaxID=1529436 RepID=UPI0014256EFA|nr:mediator of RNA polymerase II transcription subunit 16-like [Anneissia japonica]